MIHRHHQCVTDHHPQRRPFILLLFLLLWPVAAAALTPMLPQVYRDQDQVVGWLMSEKLDGVRGYWDGRQLFSKQGHQLFPPEAFVRDLPPFPLEGELWGGRGRYQQTASIVLQQQPHEGWQQLRFAIFDAPAVPGGFVERIGQARAWFAAHPSPYAYVIQQQRVESRRQLHQELKRIESLGGEGLIVRRPDAPYRSGRSATILKVKSFMDAEATVVAHLEGQGRNAGRLGALLVEMADGTRFKLGSGFSDAERDSPPPLGAIVTFKYHGRYPSGIPRFATFLRIRRDRDL